MRILPAILLLLLFSCTGSSRQEKKLYSIDEQEQSDEITCWGIGEVDFDHTMQTLEELAGKEHLTQDSLFKEGMFQGFVTRLWKGTDREITVHWREDKAPYNTIDFLEITRPGSVFHFSNGIKIGTPLSEMVKQNGGTDIHLYGFGWDYGGTFIDFGKGKLAGDIPCFGGVFALPDNINADDAREIMGDIKISSSHPALKKYDPVLRVIRVKN